MTGGHITKLQVDRYLDGTISATERSEVDLHMRACSECHELLRNAIPPPSANEINLLTSYGLDQAIHLSHDETAAYVHGKTVGKRKAKIEAHIRMCSRCSFLVKDLQSFSDSLRDARPPVRSGKALQIGPAYLNFRTIAWAALVSAVVVFALFATARSRQAPLVVKNSPDRHTASPDVDDLAYQALFAQSTGANPTLQLPMTRLAQLRAGSVTLGGSDPVAPHVILLQPNATFEFSLRPTFRWADKSRSVEYTLHVTDSDLHPVATVLLSKHNATTHVSVQDSTDKVISSYEANLATEWRVPDSLSLFKPDERYLWQVESGSGSDATGDKSNRSRVAAFQMVDAEQNQALQKAESEYSSRPLLLGIVFASYGLIDEAEEQFRKQIDTNPNDPTAPRLLRLLEQGAVSVRSKLP